jgi:hypothetical protein
VRANCGFKPIYSLSTAALVVGNVIVERLANSVGTRDRLVAVLPRERCEPCACGLLRLTEGEDMYAVSIGNVVGRAERVEAAAGLRCVVPRNPGATLGTFPVANSEAV